MNHSDCKRQPRSVLVPLRSARPNALPTSNTISARGVRICTACGFWDTDRAPRNEGGSLKLLSAESGWREEAVTLDQAARVVGPAELEQDLRSSSMVWKVRTHERVPGFVAASGWTAMTGATQT